MLKITVTRAGNKPTEIKVNMSGTENEIKDAFNRAEIKYKVNYNTIVSTMTRSEPHGENILIGKFTIKSNVSLQEVLHTLYGD